MSTLSYQQADDDRRTIDDWASDHRIDSWLLPLRTRKDNPVELVALYTNAIDSMGKYQATFTTSEIGRQFHSGYAAPMKELLLLRSVSTTNRKNRFVNPNYTHLGHVEPQLTTTDERLAFLDDFEDSPTITPQWIAPQWGIKPNSVVTWLEDNRPDFMAGVRENRRRLGRTLWTVYEWTDRSQAEIGAAMPTPDGTAIDWMCRHGRDADDWSPPDRPTDEPWWKRHNGNANP